MNSLLAYDCVLLAAGLSSRFEGSKLLQTIASQPIVGRSLEHALAACRRVILVLGHEADATLQAAGDFDPVRVQVVTNERYRSGMFSSIQAGMRAVRSDWFFVAPADLPDLTPTIFDAIAGASVDAATSRIDAAGDETPRAIVPVHGEQRGHPVLIHHSVIAHTLERPVDGGPMRTVLASFAVRYVELDDPAIIRDVDTAADLRRYEGGDTRPAPRTNRPDAGPAAI